MKISKNDHNDNFSEIFLIFKIILKILYNLCYDYHIFKYFYIIVFKYSSLYPKIIIIELPWKYVNYLNYMKNQKICHKYHNYLRNQSNNSILFINYNKITIYCISCNAKIIILSKKNMK